jgi:hypothetical protein
MRHWHKLNGFELKGGRLLLRDADMQAPPAHLNCLVVGCVLFGRHIYDAEAAGFPP